jgi:hypothetical protein
MVGMAYEGIDSIKLVQYGDIENFETYIQDCHAKTVFFEWTLIKDNFSGVQKFIRESNLKDFKINFVLVIDRKDFDEQLHFQFQSKLFLPLSVKDFLNVNVWEN